MAELLNIYQDNIIVIYNKITKLLNIFTNLTVEKFELHSKDIEINLKEADRMLRQMDLELTTNNTIDISTKTVFKKNYQLYKNKYDTFKKTFFQEKEKFSYTKKKEDMLIKEKINQEIENSKLYNNSDKSQMQLMFENERTIEKSKDKLHMAKINAMQIENMSKKLTIDLESQSNQMKSTQLKMQDLNQNIDSSNALISKMFDRENRNKLIFATFSIVLLSVIFWIFNSRI